MGTAAVAGESTWSDFTSKEMPSASTSSSAAQSQLEEGGGWSSVGGGCRKIVQEIPYLLFAASRVGID